MGGSHNLVANKHHHHLIEKAIDAFNAHDLKRWLDFYAEHALHFQPNRAEPLRGKAEIGEDYLLSTWTAFPDFHIEVVRAFGEAKWICVMGIFTGTHTGALAGADGGIIAPTHKAVRIPLCMVVKIEEDMAVEVHEYSDQLGFWAQLGLAP